MSAGVCTCANRPDRPPDRAEPVGQRVHVVDAELHDRAARVGVALCPPRPGLEACRGATCSPRPAPRLRGPRRRAAPSPGGPRRAGERHARPSASRLPPSHACRMRSPASTLSAIGFSTKTCRPRSAHASACSSCTSLGVASTTPSTPGCSIASSSLAAGSQPKRSANSRRLSSFRLKQVATSSSARPAASARRGAHMPVPTTATAVIRAAREASPLPRAASCTARSRNRGSRPRAAGTPPSAPRGLPAPSAPTGSAGRASP